MNDYAMEQIQRERSTEAEVRWLDTSDIVRWIHRLEDEVSEHKELADLAAERERRLVYALRCIESTPPVDLDECFSTNSWWTRLVRDMRNQAREALANHEHNEGES